MINITLDDINVIGDASEALEESNEMLSSFLGDLYERFMKEYEDISSTSLTHEQENEVVESCKEYDKHPEDAVSGAEIMDNIRKSDKIGGGIYDETIPPNENSDMDWLNPYKLYSWCTNPQKMTEETPYSNYNSYAEVIKDGLEALKNYQEHPETGIPAEKVMDKVRTNYESSKKSEESKVNYTSTDDWLEKSVLPIYKKHMEHPETGTPVEKVMDELHENMVKSQNKENTVPELSMEEILKLAMEGKRVTISMDKLNKMFNKVVG